MTWQPLVTGDERVAIECVLREIVDGITAIPPATLLDHIDRATLRAYLAQEDVIPDPDDVALDSLAKGVAMFARERTQAALFGGAAGLGWCLAHVAGDETAEQVCTAIDQVLGRQVAAWEGDYDLIAGLVGIGVYALARGEAGVLLATSVVARLEHLALPRRDGVAWHTPPERLAPWQRTEAPRGVWNLGLSHGTAGVIALLARLVAIPRARALLDQAMTFLCAIEGPLEARFPAWLAGGPDEPDVAGAASSRLAWCYNDLGVAVAMLAAGRATGNATWSGDALALARNCAGRTGDPAKLDDAGLCHGYFGAAHLFQRLHHATGEACFAEAARRWLAHGLATRDDRPIAGFPRKLGDGSDDWTADASLLTGAAGVALALHAMITSVEPGWDQLLLVDLAPPSSR